MAPTPSKTPLADVLLEFEELNMELAELEEQIRENRRATLDQLKQRAKLTKKIRDVATKIPDTISNLKP